MYDKIKGGHNENPMPHNTLLAKKKFDPKKSFDLENLGPGVQKLLEILIHRPPKMAILRPKSGLNHSLMPVSRGNTTKNVYNEF